MNPLPKAPAFLDPCSDVRLVVYGSPAPKGSKKFVGTTKTGRGIMVEDSARIKPWMEAIKWAIIECGRPTVPGPVRVRIVFTIAKPQSAPKKRVTYPSKKPDLDKCVRGVFDSLVQMGVIEDDARVIWLECGKVFSGEHAESLAVPGAVITVTAVEP